jgi:hypothetical protein
MPKPHKRSFFGALIFPQSEENPGSGSATAPGCIFSIEQLQIIGFSRGTVSNDLRHTGMILLAWRQGIH